VNYIPKRKITRAGIAAISLGGDISILTGKSEIGQKYSSLDPIGGPAPLIKKGIF